MAITKASGTHGWVSIVLRPLTLFGFVFLVTSIILGILALIVLSRQRSGFVAISSDSSFILGSSLELNLLWTTLPGIVLRLTAMYWDAIVAAFVDRQPYVELSRTSETHGVPFRKSVLLDYRTTFSFIRWRAAFKNRHILIGLAIILALIFSTFATPLASGFIVPRPVALTSAISLIAATEYDPLGLNTTTNWKPVFDKVSTVVLYNGDAYPWTNDNFAFPAFARPSGGAITSSQANITTLTNGTTADVDCVDVTNYQASVRSVTAGIMTRIALTGNDRGCAFDYDFGTANTTEIHLETFQAKCSSGLEAYKGRLIFVAGRHDSTSAFPLVDLSVISCKAIYSTAEGHLTFSTTTNVTDMIFEKTKASFAGGHPRADIIEFNLFLSADFSLNAPWSTSHFGSNVLYLAMQKEPSAYLGVDTLISCIERVFKATYITASAMYSFPPNSNPGLVTATLSVPQTRLFVIEWLAGVSIAMLVLCLIFAVLIWIVVQRNSTMLDEEPQGLLSAAGLLHGSDIFGKLVDGRCRTELFDGQLVKFVSGRYDVDKSTCILRRKPEHGHPVVGILNLEPDDGTEDQAQPMARDGVRSAVQPAASQRAIAGYGQPHNHRDWDHIY